MVTGLNRLSEIDCPGLPRLADAVKWVIACETAVWPEGLFWRAYSSNRSEARANALDADPVASAVRALMQSRTEWAGTATQLLATLAKSSGARMPIAGWPTSVNALSSRLRKIAPLLREVGISITRDRAGHGGDRMIYITTATPRSPAPDAPPPPAEPASDDASNIGRSSSQPADDADAADGGFEAPQADPPHASTPWSMRL